MQIEDDAASRLSRITTLWSLVDRAHAGDTQAINAAQRAIVDRYAGAAYRYLVAGLRDAEAADEVFQEFVLKIIKGGFRNAAQDRGRFRDYVKTSLRRLVADYYRRLQRTDPLNGAAEIRAAGELAADANELSNKFDASFVSSCRAELLDRCWAALKLAESAGGPELFSVLRYRAEHPDANSATMASELTNQLKRKRAFSAAGIRKTLQFARDKFAELLLYELTQMIGSDDLDELETELIDLGLQQYCQSVLVARKRSRESGD